MGLEEDIAEIALIVDLMMIPIVTVNDRGNIKSLISVTERDVLDLEINVSTAPIRVFPANAVDRLEKPHRT